MNLVLLEPDEVDASGSVGLSDRRARHLRDVLHVAPGQSVRVGLVNGPLGRATVAAVSADDVRLDCRFDEEPPARPAVDLLLAVPRPKVLRRLWPQVSALGVGQVILTNAARVERPYFDTHFLSPAVYRPLLVEGLQQARDTRLPTVSIHRQFRVLLEDTLDALGPWGRRLVAHPGTSRRVFSALAGAGPDERLLLAVGPEGGWNAFELDLMSSRGFVTADAGPRTLRSDTAVVALLALVHDALRGRC